MKVVMLRFPHLAEQILQKLNNEGLAKSREVKQCWQTFIDERDYPWLRIVNIPTVLAKGKMYLHLAAEHGQIEAFEMVLNEDNNADPKDNWGTTPYLIACKKGRMNIVSMLMKKSKELKVDLNKRDNSRRTAFHLACEEGHSDIATLIMKNSSKLKINLNTKHSGGGTAFHEVCSGGHSEIAEIMMKKSSKLKINFSTKDNRDNTGFHSACFKGHFEIVKMILENSPWLQIDLNKKDIGGCTGFELAIMYGHLNIAEMVIDKSLSLKINLNTTCSGGLTVFHLACLGSQSDTCTKIVEMVIEMSEYHKIDLTAKDKRYGETGYQMAEFFKMTEVINLIKNKMPSLVVPGLGHTRLLKAIALSKLK